jgi:hypothetical protein
MRGTWGGSPITYTEIDLGHSQGAYYALENRKTGQVLGTGGKTNDAAYSGNVPDAVAETASSTGPSDTQLWHVMTKGSGQVTSLNKAGGRAIGLWEGSTGAGTQLTQWMDDNGGDKLWNLVSQGDGYVQVQTANAASMCATAASAGAPVTLQTASVNDPESQQWKLVEQLPTVSSATPTVSGKAQVGHKLTAAAGEWSPAPVALSYRWLRDGNPISGAIASSYSLTGADYKHHISVRVTGSKAGYNSASATSARTAGVTAGTITTHKVSIQGTTKVGRTLKAVTTAWSPSPIKLSYRWYRDGKKIAGAIHGSYKLTTADRGKKVTVTITGMRTGYTSRSVSSAPTRAIQ